MSGLAYDVTYTVVDAAIDGTPPPPIRRVWFAPSYLPDGLLLRHMSPDGVWWLDFQLPVGAPADLVEDPERVTGLIRAHLDEIGFVAQNVRPIWISSYKARALKLERFRHGRVLFAGDAAHLVTSRSARPICTSRSATGPAIRGFRGQADLGGGSSTG